MSMIQARDTKLFFKYVFPSILSFALSGVYAIVDGFFVGNSLGDVGLSAVNIAYPIVAFIQAVGTGIGMGGAIYYSINKAEKKEKEARMFTAAANWLMIAFSVILTVAVLCWYNPLLRILGASGTMLSLAEEYIVVVTLGTILQIFGTGLVPLIRNLGGSFYAMIAMMAGFISNIILDYLFVWVWEQGVTGAGDCYRNRARHHDVDCFSLYYPKEAVYLKNSVFKNRQDVNSCPENRNCPFWPCHVPQHLFDYYQPVFRFLRRGIGDCNICLHCIYDLYYLPDISRRGRWQPASH